MVMLNITIHRRDVVVSTIKGIKVVSFSEKYGSIKNTNELDRFQSIITDES